MLLCFGASAQPSSSPPGGAANDHTSGLAFRPEAARTKRHSHQLPVPGKRKYDRMEIRVSAADGHIIAPSHGL